MGICNRQTGKCMCKPDYSSSGKDGKPGTRGECGYHEVREISSKMREAMVDYYGLNGGLATNGGADLYN